jgi:hypothetical protein
MNAACLLPAAAGAALLSHLVAVTGGLSLAQYFTAHAVFNEMPRFNSVRDRDREYLQDPAWEPLSRSAKPAP